MKSIKTKGKKVTILEKRNKKAKVKKFKETKIEDDQYNSKQNSQFECCSVTKVSHEKIMQCFVNGEYYKFCNMEKPCPNYINRSKNDS
mgnify:CR=1 FL=1